MAQRSILSFTGFKRKIEFRGELVECPAEKNPRPPPGNSLCRVCSKPFLSTQGRAQHEIWSHSSVDLRHSDGNKITPAVTTELEPATYSESEQSGTSSAATVIDIDEQCVGDKRRGAEKRTSYSVTFKMNMLDYCDEHPKVSDTEVAEVANTPALLLTW